MCESLIRVYKNCIQAKDGGIKKVARKWQNLEFQVEFGDLLRKAETFYFRIEASY